MCLAQKEEDPLESQKDGFKLCRNFLLGKCSRQLNRIACGYGSHSLSKEQSTAVCKVLCRRSTDEQVGMESDLQNPVQPRRIYIYDRACRYALAPCLHEDHPHSLAATQIIISGASSIGSTARN